MLIVLTGPASAGKDTILFKLIEIYPDLKRVITTTTRPKRPGETQDKDYHFVSREQFEQMIKNGDFLEYVDFFGNLYGTTKEELIPLSASENLIWRVETSRAAKINEVLSPQQQAEAVVIYIDVPDWEVLRNRMKKRGMSDEDIQVRLKQDAADFQQYKNAFTHIIYNKEGELESTLQKERNLRLIKVGCAQGFF